MPTTLAQDASAKGKKNLSRLTWREEKTKMKARCLEEHWHVRHSAGLPR